MPSLLLIARAEWRTRWWSLLLLGLIAGLAGGTVASSATLARRTATADARLATATNADDVRSLIIGGDPVTTSRIGQEALELPGVADGRVVLGGVARLEGEAIVYLSLQVGPSDWGQAVMSPVVARGRLPRFDRADEIVINETATAGAGGLPIDVGDELMLHFLTAEEFGRFDAEVPLEGRAGTQTVTVVGAVRLPGDLNDLPPLLGTAALAAAQPKGMGVLGAALVDLEPGADLDAYADAVNRAGVGVERDPVLADFPPLSVIGTAAQAEVATGTTTDVLTNGLLLIAVVAGLVGAIAVAQASLRHHAAGANSQRIEAAIGLTPSARAAARLIAAAPAIGVAAVITAGAGLIAARFEPPGTLRLVEPHPGWAPNLLLVAVTTALVVVLVLGAVWVGSARALRSTAPRIVREGTLVDRLAARVGSTPLGLGVRFALGRPSGRIGTTARPAAATVALGLVGVLGAATYSASLDRLVSTPLRYGFSTDIVIADAGPALVDVLEDDPRFDVVVAGTSADLILDGRSSGGISQVSRRGGLEWELESGRPPATDTEIVLGTRMAEELGKGTGDAVTARDASGAEHELSVVGVGVIPAYGGSGFGRASALTPEGLESVASAASYGELGLSVAPGVPLRATADELSERYEVEVANLPRDVANLHEIDRVPQVLAAFLALLCIVTLAHGIAMVTRRHRGELATLRAFGLTGRQVRRAVLVLALATALAGVVVAVPLGLALGSTVWRVVAEGAAALGDPQLPWPVVSLAVPVLAAVALLLAAPPAVRAARRPVVDDLRSE